MMSPNLDTPRLPFSASELRALKRRLRRLPLSAEAVVREMILIQRLRALVTAQSGRNLL